MPPKHAAALKLRASGLYSTCALPKPLLTTSMLFGLERRFESAKHKIGNEFALIIRKHSVAESKTMSFYAEKIELLVKPQRSYLVLTSFPETVRTLFSVTGSKGKTSTAYALSALLPSACRFTSPHCFSVRERIGFGSQPLSEEAFARLLTEFDYGFFGNLTAGYLAALQRFGSPVAVCEAGIGGLLDTTNAPFAGKKIGILTSLELEHVGLLGPGVEDIVYYKLGYFGGARAVVLPKSLDLHGVDRFYGLYDKLVRVADVQDKMQQNAILARRAALEAGLPVRKASTPDQTVFTALPGRCSVVGVRGRQRFLHTARADLSIYSYLGQKIEGRQFRASTAIGFKPHAGDSVIRRDSAYEGKFFIDSAHTADSIGFAVKKYEETMGPAPATVVFCQTKKERNYWDFINTIANSMAVKELCYLPASSSVDFAHSTAEDRESAEIGLEIAAKRGARILQQNELAALRGNVFVVGSEHGACLAEWLLLRGADVFVALNHLH